MANYDSLRDYRFDDPDLIEFTQHVCDSMTRDITNFGVFGITALAVTNLETLVSAFEIFPTDDYIMQDVKSATLSKDQKIEEMKVIIRQMAARVALHWGNNSPKYKSLGIADMSKLSDAAFLSMARMVYAFMFENKTELAAEGLTTGMLTDMDTKIDALDDAKREQIEKLSFREEKTEERVGKGNEVYGYVTKYCDIGKTIWNGVNAAKYGDYVIYGTGGGGAVVAPTNFAYNFAANLFSWDAQAAATSYQLEASDNGVDWSEIYAGADATHVYIPASGVVKHYRVRARNASGFGAYAAELVFAYYDSLAASANIAAGLSGSDFPPIVNVNWDAVAGATEYRVYRSIVPATQPAGTYILITTTADTMFAEPGVELKRMYYYVVGINSYRTGADSAAAWVDVPANPA
ncbi:MAG: hypothetical protein NT007_13800 [Candidatus Kapabacteria bacterium]|nr:hypothetical protein [Candidatus Kapabacteria bacterium]